MTDENPADRLRRERDIIRARGLTRSHSDLFWGSGNSAQNTSGETILTTPLNNGPRPQGGVAARIDGGLAQSEGLSRTEPKRRVGLPTDKYPFKTLSYFYDIGPGGTVTGGTYLGGDRLSQLLTPAPNLPQLANLGGKAGWSASLGAMGTALGFLNPNSSVTLELPVAFYPQGGNVWANIALPDITRTITRRVISGSPPSNESNFPVVSNVTSAWNFVGAYDEEAELSGASWAPYSGGEVQAGTITWTASTTITPSPYSNSPISSSQTQSLSGTSQYPVKVFSYSPAGRVEAAGARVRSRNATLTSTFSRSQDWSDSSKTESISDESSDKISIQVPIVGGLSLEYLFDNSYKTTISTSDARSVAGGTHANSTSTQSEVFSINKTIDPLKKKLHGQNAALCLVEQTGAWGTREIQSTANITSSTVTRVLRPSMQSRILFSTTGYLHSGSLTGQGPLKGWYSSGSPPDGTVGEEAPQATIYRRGNPPLPDGFAGGGSYLRAVEFDAPGAYSDNSIRPPDVYSEYTVVEGGGIAGNIYTDVLTWTPEYNWTYTTQNIDTRVTNYPQPIAHKLLVQGQIIDLPYEQSAVNVNIDASIVNVPSGPGVLSISSTNPFGINLETAVLKQHKIVETTNRQFVNGSNPVNTRQEDHTHTSDDLSILGKRADVYRVVDGKIKHWQGIITSYDGFKSPPEPAASRVLNGGAVETHAFIGPYPTTIYLTSLAIAVNKHEDVEYCPWGMGSGYLVVLNTDFAIMKLLNYRWCNLVAGAGDSLAKIYVASAGYVAGKVNYAAVWEFVRSGSGARAVKREDVKGKTKKGITGETLQAVLYFPM